MLLVLINLNYKIKISAPPRYLVNGALIIKMSDIVIIFSRYRKATENIFNKNKQQFNMITTVITL